MKKQKIIETLNESIGYCRLRQVFRDGKITKEEYKRLTKQ